MTLVRRVVPLLRAALVTLFLLLTILQLLSFPGQFAYHARQHPDQAWLQWPLTVFVAIEILCLQVVLVCTWRLLDLVRRDDIFSSYALHWVDAIIAALAGALLLAAGVSAWAVWGADDPGAPLLLFTLLVCGAVLGLVVVVLRDLLRRATALRTELASVI